MLFAALPILDAAGGDLTQVAYSETPLVISDDLPWLIEQLEAQPKEKRRLWIKLIGLAFEYQKPGHFDLLLEARKKFPDLEKEFSWMNPVEIDSPAGRNMKAQYLKHQRLERRLEQRRKKPLLQPPPKEKVLILLDKSERGDPNAWWRLNLEMTLEPNSRYYDFQRELEPDITALPVWQSADQQMRNRIVQAARQYVTNPPEMENSWLGTDTFYRPASAGYRALALLMTADRTFVDELPETVWKIWAPIIVAYPIDSFHDNKMHNCLLTRGYAKASEEVISALIAIIDRENREQGHLFITRRFEDCWDDRIASALFEMACSSDMKVSCVGTLFDLLIKHEYGPATEYACSQVTIPLPAQDIQRERTLALAEALFANQPFESWEVIWPCIRDDIEFGRALLEKFAGSYRHDRVGEFTQKLTERQMADIYLWLETQYPQNEDPPHRGPIGTRHFLAEFRDGLLGQLKVRGTPKSCQQLTRIANELPKLNWLKWVILEAEENTRRNTWEPPTPEQIIKLAQDSQRRYVENGEQLLELLCESLQRLQERLHSEMPAVNDLWDNRGNARYPEYCPKDEPHLSDYVARHLEQDLGPARGIVVNREVQIRRREQTDIHIDALRPAIMEQPINLVKAIIEVKGCWHPKLETAMESQLVGSYLQDNQCPNGLYLIGWFICDKWSNKDYRKKQTPTYSLSEARNHFAEKAEELSVNSTIPNLVLKSFVLDTALR